MSADRPLEPTGGAFERGLGWMVLASAAVHAVIVVALVFVPHSFLHRPPKMISYTVDLVAPDKLGGTNLVAGSKGKSQAQPKIEPAKARAAQIPKEEAPPPPPKEEKKAEPKVEEPQPKAKAPEPAKPEKPPEKQQVVLAKPTALPTATETEKPIPVAKATVTSAPKAAAATTSKLGATPTAKGVAAKSTQAAATLTPKSVPAAPKAAPTSAVAAAPKAPATPRQTAEAKAAKPVAAEQAARERDARIAEAVQRVQEQAGVRGGGAGGEGKEPGAPLSVGPGEGSGGEIRSIQYILYKNRVESTIKEKWAWAGANRGLTSVVGFNIRETGEIANVRTLVSSGDPSYDLLAERAVRAANPLPPPPAEYQKEFAEYELTFQPQEESKQ